MDLSLIFKIGAVGIIAAVLNILLKNSGRDDQALMVTLVSLVVVMTMVVQQISDLFSLIQQLFGI